MEGKKRDETQSAIVSCEKLTEISDNLVIDHVIPGTCEKLAGATQETDGELKGLLHEYLSLIHI